MSCSLAVQSIHDFDIRHTLIKLGFTSSKLEVGALSGCLWESHFSTCTTSKTESRLRQIKDEQVHMIWLIIDNRLQTTTTATCLIWFNKSTVISFLNSRRDGMLFFFFFTAACLCCRPIRFYEQKQKNYNVVKGMIFKLSLSIQFLETRLRSRGMTRPWTSPPSAFSTCCPSRLTALWIWTGPRRSWMSRRDASMT